MGKKIKPLPKMTSRRKKRINKKYKKYNKRYFSSGSKH